MRVMATRHAAFSLCPRGPMNSCNTGITAPAKAASSGAVAHHLDQRQLRLPRRHRLDAHLMPSGSSILLGFLPASLRAGGISNRMRRKNSFIPSGPVGSFSGLCGIPSPRLSPPCPPPSSRPRRPSSRRHVRASSRGDPPVAVERPERPDHERPDPAVGALRQAEQLLGQRSRGDRSMSCMPSARVRFVGRLAEAIDRRRGSASPGRSDIGGAPAPRRPAAPGPRTGGRRCRASRPAGPARRPAATSGRTPIGPAPGPGRGAACGSR